MGKELKLKNIFTESGCSIFVVIDDGDEDEMEWLLSTTDFELLPDDENVYIVRAIQVLKNEATECFISIVTPERIAETVVINSGNEILLDSFMEGTFIPSIASECFGNYELYYAKENPQIGIDVLKAALPKAVNKNVVAEDLGYILRDEGQIEQAIEAFLISESAGPSSEYVYFELSGLYAKLGDTALQNIYKQKFIENGGLV